MCRFYKEIKKQKIKNISYKNIKTFWLKNEYLSTFSGEIRRAKTIPFKFQKYRYENFICKNFQIDVYIPQKIYDVKKPGILIAIDTVSRFLFFTKIPTKEKSDMVNAFKNIISQIRKKQINLFKKTSYKNHLTFLSDMGGEFISKKLQNFLSSLNASTINIKSDRRGGPSLISRVSRTLNQIIAARKSVTRFSLTKNFKKIVYIYNHRKSSIIQRTPFEALTTFNDILPWGPSDFDYESNKIEIDKTLKALQKKIPLLFPVRILISKRKRENVFKKEATGETFSKKIFYIHSFRRPLIKGEGIIIKVISKKGIIESEHFYKKQIKVLPSSLSQIEINQIISEKSINNIIFYKVLVKTFPKEEIFKIKKSLIKSYKFTKNAERELKNI